MRSPFERFLCVLVCLWALSARAQQMDPTEQFDATKDIVSAKYNAGPFLMYDCFDKHWVCASPENYDICKTDRAEEIDRGRIELSCVPSKVFEKKRDCYAELKRLIVGGDVPRTCLTGKERRRFIGFR